MGLIIKLIGKLTKIHQKYMFGNTVTCNKTKICTQRIGIQVNTWLRMRTVSRAPSFWSFSLRLPTDCNALFEEPR